MRTINSGWFIFFLGFAVSLGACSSDAGSGGGSGGEGAREPDDAPIQGFSDDPVGDSLVDLVTADAVPPEELEEDDSGRVIEMTRLDIVFYPDTTTLEANELLTEIGAQIVASIGGYPAVVVAIPNPGTIQALDSLIDDIESRSTVEWVLKSMMSEIDILPQNVDIRRSQAIANGQDPNQIEDWLKIANSLAVRGPAAWNAQGAIQSDRRTSVIVRDYFGKGIGTLPGFQSIFDAVPAGEYPSSANDYLIGTVQTPLICDTDLTRDTRACAPWSERSRQHGYLVLGLHAGKHSNSTATDAAFLSGMARNGVKLTAIDLVAYSGATAGMFSTVLAITQMLTNEGMIVESLSLGNYCTGTESSDACQTSSDLRKRTVERIRRIRHAGLENRLLTVVAAGNRRAANGPHDAETHSHWNASTLISRWFDDDGNLHPALTNTLVVENVRVKGGISGGGPYSAECTNHSSCIGGHVAGIGSGAIYKATGPLPDSETKIIVDGGTSSATPQVSGLAAYMGAIDPTLTPQRAIEIIRATATPVPASGSNPFCTTVTGEGRADLIDAYAAVLALDSPNWLDPQDAHVRMALLDVTSGSGGNLPDRTFDEWDLSEWVDRIVYDVRDGNDGVPRLDYGRYDINGDGYTGGIGTTGRFDLDIDDVASPDVFASNVRNFLLDQKFPNSNILFDESALTDLDIICYYAHTDFYEGDPLERDDILTDRDDPNVHLCDPCAAAGASLKANGFASKQLPAFCEGVVITVSPDPVILAPGQPQQFTATVTGSDNTDVTWTATGGTIDPTGIYTAGSIEGSFSVTATSNEDPSVTASATVTIQSSEPFDYAGLYSTVSQYFDQGEPDRVRGYEMDVRQNGDRLLLPIPICIDSNGYLEVQINGSSLTGCSDVQPTCCIQSGTIISDPVPTISGTAGPLGADTYVEFVAKRETRVFIGPTDLIETDVDAGGRGVVYRLYAIVAGTNDKDISWTATGGTLIPDDDRAEYIPGSTAGTFEITATSVADPNLSAVITVIISAVVP